MPATAATLTRLPPARLALRSRLSSNNMRGSLPSELSAVRATLKYFHVAGNKLTGPLPDLDYAGMSSCWLRDFVTSSVY